MTDEPLKWPEERISRDATSRWVASVCGHEVELPTILQSKSWGVTARFANVVLKASFTPLFPQVMAVHALLERALPGRTARVVASEVVGEQLWTLFEHVPGPTAEEIGTPTALLAIACELAAIQTAVSGHDLSGIPAFDVRSVPASLLQDLQDQPSELVAWLHSAQPALQADADALAAIPSSLDHPDVNSTNAILREDGRVVLLDWEETTVGCPLFSLDRLLHESREHSAEELVTDAYLDGFTSCSRHDVERAMRLVPLKLAVEARAFARRLGWPHPHTRYTTRLLEQARRLSA